VMEASKIEASCLVAELMVVLLVRRVGAGNDGPLSLQLSTARTEDEATSDVVRSISRGFGGIVGVRVVVMGCKDVNSKMKTVGK